MTDQLPASFESSSEEERHRAFLLREFLRLAIPLQLTEVRLWPDDRVVETAHECAQQIAEKGDVLQFTSKKTRGETARAFGALATGLACLALQPGGVDFLGDHWEIDKETGDLKQS